MYPLCRCLIRFVITSIWLCSLSAAYGNVKLPVLVSDGMILQRNQVLTIWGWADAAEPVAVSFQNKEYKAVTGVNKKWEITLPKMKEGGPYAMTITGKNQIHLSNILIGDVWLCSGQSNMEFILLKAQAKYPAEIAASTNPNIRQFMVRRSWSYQHHADVETVGGWMPANPQNVLDFTAVGYFFAAALYKKYGVPIGLINSSYGGTPIEGWMSEGSLTQFPEVLAQYNSFQDTAKVNEVVRHDKAIVADWYQKVKAGDAGLHQANNQKWYNNNYDFTAWKTITFPAFWQEQGVKKNGVFWFKKVIELPAGFTGQTATLSLGNIVDEDSTYVNGVLVGSTSSKYLPRNYTLAQNVLKAGKNIITIRVLNKEGAGGFLKDKLYQLKVGETVFDLKGEWQYAEGISIPPLVGATMKQFAKEPVVLYHSMIEPIVSYAVKGVIWYQGETNVGQAEKYQDLFPAMIEDWRSKWQQPDLPFVYVQLANYLATSKEPDESPWAELREAQTKTLSLHHTGMAVIHDIGEWNDIHPLNKKTVGERLAFAAEKVAYNDQQVVYSGPTYQSVKTDGNKMIITFSNTGSGLVASDGDSLKQFAIAGANQQFVWANAKIEGNTVVVWSDTINNPVAVRYAWANNPEGANLYNKEGLPASSFRTDHWTKVSNP